IERKDTHVKQRGLAPEPCRRGRRRFRHIVLTCVGSMEQGIPETSSRLDSFGDINEQGWSRIDHGKHEGYGAGKDEKPQSADVSACELVNCVDECAGRVFEAA